MANTEFIFESEKSIKDYLNILSRRKWIAIAFFVICSTLVTLGTFLQTPLYKSTTTVIIEGENQNILNAEEAASADIGFDIFENYIETQMAIIQSNGVAGKVFRELELDQTERYWNTSDQIPGFLQHPFLEDIYLERLPGTRLIAISAENPEPDMAAKISDLLADTYSQENLRRRSLTFIQNQRMASLNAEFLRLQNELDALSSQYGPKHPQMVTLREKIETLSRRIHNAEVSAATVGKRGFSEKAILMDKLMDVQERSVTLSSRMNNVLIIDRAQIPSEPTKPNKRLNITIGFIMGLVGGIFLAFLIDYLDDSVKGESDLKKVIRNINYLGAVPVVRNVGPKNLPREARRDLLVDSDGNSGPVESFRLMRTAIFWFARSEGNLKDFAVLSSGAGEGKTMMASNIAIALAQVDKNVLLVDTDIRRGRLHLSYNKPQNPGLGHYLTEENVDFNKIAHKTRVPNLTVVTCGESVINSSGLLLSPKMSEFIEYTRKRFDFIVYDTPPVNVVSDASILISQIHGALLVARHRHTHARAIPKALSKIKASGAKIIGVAMNGMETGDKKSYDRYFRNK